MNAKDYLERIKYRGETTPTLDNLARICGAHVSNVPFENLDLFGGPPLSMELEGLYEKIVRRCRGGMSFELNRLFQWLLVELGFTVTVVQSESYCVVNDAFVAVQPSLMVTMDDGERYLIDVSFSKGFCLSSPLKFELLKEQPQPQGMFRVRSTGTQEVVYIEMRWFDVVDSTGEASPAEDIEKSFGDSKYRVKDWVIQHRITVRSFEWNHFVPHLDAILSDSASRVRTNSICAILRASTATVLWGNSLIQKQTSKSHRKGPEMMLSMNRMLLSDFPALLEVIRCVFGMREFEMKFSPQSRDITSKPFIVY
uniref:arylamine N-acetyltransferase n=1 Tax=Ciona savignyi TaxID=51511 RepID=H2YIT2_CIOSA